MPSTQSLRRVQKIVKGQETSEGAGVKLRRALGIAELSYLDPFLLLDEFKSDDRTDYIAGFPDHPHRGFETVTYMLAGAMEHRDHIGNAGHLSAGSVQWMTAGRGIIHSEMPQQQDGLMWGFQLWVNLPADLKMCPPRYQDIPPEGVPEVTTSDGATVRVIAGEVAGVLGAVTGIVTEPLYLDVTVPRESRFVQDVPSSHNAFCYVFEGEATFGISEADLGRFATPGYLLVLGDGDAVTVATSDSNVRFLLLAAKPLGEPVARYGPFVMNTQEQLTQTLQDLRDGTFLG